MDVLLKNTFNNEAEIYDETTQYLMLNYNDTLDLLVEQIDFGENERFTILDVGCGTGNLLCKLRNRFPNAIIYGVDFADDMLSVAKGKKINGVKYFNSDLFLLEELPLPFFDVITVSFTFHNFHSVDEHLRAMKIINGLLAVNGTLIIADLIDFNDPFGHKENQNKLVSLMRNHGLSDAEILKWLGILKIEDSPLSIQTNTNLLLQAGFESVKSIVFNDRECAIFSARKKTDAIHVKSELLCWGIKPNELSRNIYNSQNPNDITKTGNNGVFLTIDGLDVLVGINNETNRMSPYELFFEKEHYYLTKRKNKINLIVEPIAFPEWAFHPISNSYMGDRFSNYFVYEGHGYLHLAYKSCSFAESEKCKFCSVKRREESEDCSAELICNALDEVLPLIPENVHFCLGGGTYLPLKQNVEFFKKIVKHIRNSKRSNPIWIEMIPPSISEIKELIDAGATSFGFNIEIWDENLRKNICPGKSTIPKSRYLNACKYVVDTLGDDYIGSCLICGLDTKENIIKAVDALLEIGVQPCILLYKNFDTDLGDYLIPVQYHRDYYYISKYTAEKALKKNLMFKNSEGCLRCNCCTIMHDLQIQIQNPIINS